jgi:hypothetical protein
MFEELKFVSVLFLTLLHLYLYLGKIEEARGNLKNDPIRGFSPYLSSILAYHFWSSQSHAIVPSKTETHWPIGTVYHPTVSGSNLASPQPIGWISIWEITLPQECFCGRRGRERNFMSTVKINEATLFTAVHVEHHLTTSLMPSSFHTSQSLDMDL